MLDEAAGYIPYLKRMSQMTSFKSSKLSTIFSRFTTRTVQRNDMVEWFIAMCTSNWSHMAVRLRETS